MNKYADELRNTAKAMVAPGKGVLAMDESNGTCNKRLASVGAEQTEEMRRQYRELIITTPALSDSISGAILYDETIRQSSSDGKPFRDLLKQKGMIPGIKVDTGAKDLAGHPNENVTEGLDGLRDRIAEYYQMGARFAKWRAVITIGDGIPSRACIEANAHALARYAALCQEGGLVPIVEPEVMMDGDHTIERCYEVTSETLRTVFDQLATQGVELDQIILKPNMVLPGKGCSQQASVDEVADMTMRCLMNTVPAAVTGVAFLSGGQDEKSASAHLNAMNVKYGDMIPWEVTFSYARAIQGPALENWQGQKANVEKSQSLLAHRAKCNSAAHKGEYSPELEKQPAMV